MKKGTTKSKKILAIIISIILSLTSNVFVSASEAERSTDFIPLNPITENEVSLFSNGVNSITVDKGYGVNLSSNQRVEFKCILPESGNYTIIVTNSLTDAAASSAKGRLSVLNGGSAFNASYNTTDRGASIKFQGLLRQGITGTISLMPGSSGGQIYFMIRRQKAVSYTYDFGSKDINTHDDAGVINTLMGRIGYIARHHKNKNFITANENGIFFDNNNEVLLFSSHGTPGNIFYLEGNTKTRLSADVFGSLRMNNVKVALWSTCSSAASPIGGGNSINYQAYLNGVSASVGFAASVYDTSARRFSNKFFTSLKDGYNVSESCSRAANQFLFNDAVKDWRVSGNGITTITTPGNRRMIQEYVSESEINEFQQALSQDEYQPVEQTGGVIRYYKSINGVLTNDFYDIKKNSEGDYISLEKSKININKEDIDNLNNKPQKKSTLLKSYTRDLEYYYKIKEPELTVTNIKTEEYIIKIGEELIPLVIYQVELRHGEGYDDLDIKCFNLITGEEINYDDISLI